MCSKRTGKNKRWGREHSVSPLSRNHSCQDCSWFFKEWIETKLPSFVEEWCIQRNRNVDPTEQACKRFFLKNKEKEKEKYPGPFSKEEVDAIKNEIRKLRRLVQKAYLEKDAKVAAKHYQEIADLYERLHDEENARYYRRMAKCL
jgi:hypothetical protein